MALFSGITEQAIGAEVGSPVNPGTVSQLALAQISASGASKASTTLLASAPGPVAVEWGINANTAGASGTVSLTITFTHASTGASTTVSSGSVSLASANVCSVGGGILRCKPGTKISYATTWSTAGKYDLDLSCEAV